MDIHQNARLTFRSREALAKKIVVERSDVEGGCSRFNVSRKTAAKWVRRYRILGLPGLRDRSSRPRHSPRRTSLGLAAQVIALASPAASRLSHRASHRPQPRHRQPHPAARSVSTAGVISIPLRRWCATSIPLPGICSISTSRA